MMLRFRIVQTVVCKFGLRTRITFMRMDLVHLPGLLPRMRKVAKG